MDAGKDSHRNVARIVTDDHPGPMAAAVLGSLGTDATRLVSVDLVRPSLETVFLALTGRAYASDNDGSTDAPAPETVEDDA